MHAWRDHVGLKVEVRAQEIIDRANQMGALGTYQMPRCVRRCCWWLRTVVLAAT